MISTKKGTCDLFWNSSSERASFLYSYSTEKLSTILPQKFTNTDIDGTYWISIIIPIVKHNLAISF